MKKWGLLIAGFMMAGAAFSQYSIGLRGGVVFSAPAHQQLFSSRSQTAVNTIGSRPFCGYQAGAFYKVKITRRWKVSAEPGIITLGSRERFLTEEQINNQDFKPHYFSRRAGYLEVPVYLQYQLTRFYLSAGPGISFRVFSVMNGIENRRSNMVFYKRTDFGANVLAGYRAGRGIDINLRYYQGVRNVELFGPYERTYNRALSLLVLYSIKDY